MRGTCWLFRRLNQRQYGSDGSLLSRLDYQTVDHASVEYFDLDGALLGIDDCDDVAPGDRIARLLEPLHERACFHVGAERGHPELDHRATGAGINARAASIMA